jgi:hypothetical protein
MVGVDISRYETTLLPPGRRPENWYSQTVDSYHIKTLLDQAQASPAHDHYAPLGVGAAAQQTLVYTQNQQIKIITFDSASHTPAPATLWDLVAAIRRVGKLPPLTGRPTGALAPPTISSASAMESSTLQLDLQGVARVYVSGRFAGAKQLSRTELTDIRTEVAATNFFKLDPYYTFADPPGGIVDADFLSVYVTQAGQSKEVTSRGGTGPPAFQWLLDTLYGLADDIQYRCRLPEEAKPVVQYQANDASNRWEMAIDTNGGVHWDLNAQDIVASYLDPSSLARLQRDFQQAQFEELPAWYEAAQSVDYDQQHTVQVSLVKGEHYKGVHALTGAKVPPGLQIILEDLALIYNHAQRATAQAMITGACPDYIRLAHAGPVLGMPTSGIGSQAQLVLLLLGSAGVLIALGTGIRR